MKVPTTRLDMMMASTLIQNPIIMPRQVKPEDMMKRGEHIRSAFTGAAVPGSASDVKGKSEGVQRAKRAKSREAASPSDV